MPNQQECKSGEISESQFTDWWNYKVKIEKDAGHEMFMGIPDRWYEPRTLGCRKGHVSKMSLKSSVKGEVCLGCGESIAMIPPEFHGVSDTVLKASFIHFLKYVLPTPPKEKQKTKGPDDPELRDLSH